MQLIVCTERNNRISFALNDDVKIVFGEDEFGRELIELNDLDRGQPEASRMVIMDLGESCVEIVTIPDEDMPAEWIGNKYKWDGIKLVTNDIGKFKHTDEPDRDMSISHIIKKMK